MGLRIAFYGSIVLALAVFLFAFSAAGEEEGDADDDGGGGEGDDEYGVCNNIKYVTNTFKDMPSSKKICQALGESDKCLDHAHVQTWGPSCKDVQFYTATTGLQRYGGCEKFAELRDDGNYYQCAKDGSKTCKASAAACANTKDGDSLPFRLVPCPSTKQLDNFKSNPSGQVSCNNVTLEADKTCSDYVERDVGLTGLEVVQPGEGNGRIHEALRRQVQAWSRCEAVPGDPKKCQPMSDGSAYKFCARVIDL